MEGVIIFGLIALVAGYWILALFLLIKGLFQMNKDKSKGLTKLIIGVIMLKSNNLQLMQLIQKLSRLPLLSNFLNFSISVQ
jgi:hypothetical protein